MIGLRNGFGSGTFQCLHVSIALLPLCFKTLASIIKNGFKKEGKNFVRPKEKRLFGATPRAGRIMLALAPFKFPSASAQPFSVMHNNFHVKIKLGSEK